MGIRIWFMIKSDEAVSKILVGFIFSQAILSTYGSEYGLN